ncbi:hypothetical protein HanIR_Chr02g0057331 [Helianthus annuus]|nr:hypothetical protein HanIR_Chr02g0057331 [Helianthus annuus]
MSSSLRLVRSPIVTGSDVRSLKLPLRLRISRFERRPMDGDRVRSSLKWASRN